MVKNPNGHELQKHTLNLVRGDVERIRDLYPTADASVIIRNVVHDFVLKHEGEQMDHGFLKTKVEL